MDNTLLCAKFNYAKVYVVENFRLKIDEKSARDCLREGTSFHLYFIRFTLTLRTLKGTRSIHKFIINVLRGLDRGNMNQLNYTFKEKPKIFGIREG